MDEKKVRIKGIKTKEMMAKLASVESLRRLYARSQSSSMMEDLNKAEYEFKAACAPLEEAIHDAEKRAKVRTIMPYEVLWALKAVERRLEIPKKYMEGITARVDLNATTVPGSYNGIPESTQFVAVYKNGQWVITWVGRDKCMSGNHRYEVDLPDAARAAIIAAREKFY